MRRLFSIQVMPLAAMALVVLLLGVLLWLLHRTEVEEREKALIEDVLWVEQDLHFHFTALSERLGLMADRLGRDGGGVFDDESRALVGAIPEIRRLALRDGGGRLLAAYPGLDPAAQVESAGDWADRRTLAQSLGRMVFGPPFALPGGGGWAIEGHAPVFDGGRFTGLLSAVLSFDALLTHQVPWWFARKYQLEIVDGTGTLLATKSQVQAAARRGPSHQVRLEPPGQGLEIVATAYRTETHLGRNLLAAAIFGLALSAVLSLWALRRHIRRRLLAERALRAEHAFRKAMEDSLTVGMRARDLDGRVTYVNPAFCHMVGWEAADLIGSMPPMLYWVPEEIEQTYEMHRAVLRGHAPPDGFELMLRRKNGERFRALIYEAPLIDSEGRHTGWMASFIDITERERAAELARQQAEKLQRTARLITMGEMASTLAHELNQPLSAIASYATGCLNRLAAGDVRPDELQAPLTKLGAQAQRAGQIIRRIHDFVRKSKPSVALCDLSRVVEEAMGFVEADGRKRGIRVRLAVERPGLMVEADRILIEQVLLNLARNGMEAMEGVPHPRRVLEVDVRREEATVVVRVADRGTGIDAETAAGLFTPFFTTKEEGMGMGLNICRSIVESHRGRLWYEPGAGGGSLFAFALPASDSEDEGA